MKINTSRGRGAAAALTGLALLGSGAAITSSPAAGVIPPADDCAEPVVAATLQAGDPVSGLTVDTGVVPEGFTGEILGVINDGIAPGVPMVMARLTSDAIDQYGIWQGMSGSPVYDANGDLIGAVAYGLAWGPSPVAGITPFENMDDYLAAGAPAVVKVGDRLANRIAAETDVTARQAQQGIEQLPMPVSVSGVTQRRLNQMQGKNGPKFIQLKGARAMGASSSAAAAEPETLVAGGNLGAAISSGDITAGGVGTVTSVCNGRLVGFGHPFGFFGKTTLGLMPADAIYVQEDLIAAFKIANLGEVAGMIDQDRLTGITGGFDELPPQTDITSTVTYGARHRTGSSLSYVDDYNADITFSQLLANHDVVIDAYQPGSEAATFEITGTDATGGTFNVAWNERFVSDYDISYESSWPAAEMTWLLSRMDGVTVDGVTATGVVSDDTSVWRLRTVQQKRNGGWVNVGRRNPAVVTAGGTLRLRAHLVNGDDSTWLPLTVAVPNRTTRNGFLEVTGGLSDWGNDLYAADTPAELEAAVASMTKNDQVNVSLRFFKRGKDLVRDYTSGSQSLAVQGRTWAEVKVRR